MINSDILLFPDTGPEFLRALKTAVLYSEQVHVLTLCNASVLFHLLGKTLEDATLVELRAKVHGRERLTRTAEYAQFVMGHWKELNLLVSEKVLVPLTAGAPASMRWDFSRQAEFEDQWQFGSAPLLRAFQTFPPSYFDLLVLLCKPDLRDFALTGFGSSLPFIFPYYLLMLASVAESRGIALSSWSFDYQNAVWVARERFTSDGARKYEKRKTIQASMGQVVLERHIPTAEDFSFEEILELRRKYVAELQALRVGLGDVVTHIDPTQPPEDIELQVHDVISSKIDPAVDDLRKAMASARWEARKKLGESLAKATIAVALAFAAGAPFNITAAIGALCGLAIPLVEGEIERKKLLDASRWSILLRLEGTSR